MAFDFPLTDGLDNGHTVQNTERGVYYSWNANRSKWIVTGTTREENLGSSVWVGDNPPDPAKIGDLWYNTEDDDLTLYILSLIHI